MPSMDLPVQGSPIKRTCLRCDAAFFMILTADSWPKTWSINCLGTFMSAVVLYCKSPIEKLRERLFKKVLIQLIRIPAEPKRTSLSGSGFTIIKKGLCWYKPVSMEPHGYLRIESYLKIFLYLCNSLLILGCKHRGNFLVLHLFIIPWLPNADVYLAAQKRV